MWFSFTPPDIRTHCARCRKNSHKRSGTTSSLPTPTPYISQYSPHIMNNREEAKNTRNKILFCKFSNGVSCLNSCNCLHYLQSMTLRFPVASFELQCAFRSCDVHSEVARWEWEPIMVETCDVHMCGAFLGLQCAIVTSHVF